MVCVCIKKVNVRGFGMSFRRHSICSRLDSSSTVMRRASREKESSSYAELSFSFFEGSLSRKCNH